jgi:hypothetical protein
LGVVGVEHRTNNPQEHGHEEHADNEGSLTSEALNTEEDEHGCGDDSIVRKMLLLTVVLT